MKKNTSYISCFLLHYPCKKIIYYTEILTWNIDLHIFSLIPIIVKKPANQYFLTKFQYRKLLFGLGRFYRAIEASFLVSDIFLSMCTFWYLGKRFRTPRTQFQTLSVSTKDEQKTKQPHVGKFLQVWFSRGRGFMRVRFIKDILSKLNSNKSRKYFLEERGLLLKSEQVISVWVYFGLYNMYSRTLFKSNLVLNP